MHLRCARWDAGDAACTSSATQALSTLARGRNDKHGLRAHRKQSMTDFSTIKQAVDQTGQAFDAFTKTADSRHAQLLERVEELEAKGTGIRTALGGKKVVPSDAVSVGGELVPVLRKGADFQTHYAQKQDADDLDGLTFADLMRGIAGMKTSAVATKALSVGTGTAGGYAVPTVVMPGILEALTPASACLQAGMGIVDVSMMDGKGFNWAAVDTVPTAAWRSEAGGVAESDPTFRQVATTPRSLSFYFKVSRELLADAGNMDGALRTAIAQAFAKELDRTALRGSGTPPEPTGILSTTNVGSVANGANGATQSSLRWANLHSAVQTILGYDAPVPSAAIMSPRSLVGYSALADTTNQPLARPEALKNLQFIGTSAVPNNLTVGSSSDCTEVYVGDFAQVLMVMRERPTILLANELFALNGQVGFVCHVRADIAVLYPRAFAVVTGIRAG